MLLQHYKGKETMSFFGELLRKRRKELRLGLREFALKAGLDPGNLSKIERGRLGAPQSDEVLGRICRALPARSNPQNPDKDHAEAIHSCTARERLAVS